jgi:hypothetical protein
MRRVASDCGLAYEVAFQIVQDAWLTALQNLLDAGSRHRLRISYRNLQRAKFGTLPVGGQLSPVDGKKRATDAFEGDQPGEAIEMDFLSRGHMLADVSAIIGSLDIVFGEVDR